MSRTHALLNIGAYNDLLGHPVVGKNWEGLVIKNILSVLPQGAEAFYTEDREDGTRHFIKRTPEYENRWLRVIVNVKKRRRVTVFFDRRLGRPHESKS